jgi:hypothetical protein
MQVVEQVPVETPVFLRGSERKSYRNCRQAWQWSYVDRLATPRPRGALTFGHGMHYAMELRYPPGRKRGPHPALTFEQWFRENEHKFSQWDDEGNKHDALELGIAMCNGYVDEYGDDDHIDIIAPEMPLSLDIHDKQGRYLCTWVGRTDAAFEDLSKRRGKRRRVGFFEHKTGKSIETELRVNSGYGDQGLSYAWAGSKMFQELGIFQHGENVDHILYNWLRKAMPDERPYDDAGYALNKPKKEALLEYCHEHGVMIPLKPKVEDLTAAIDATGFDSRMLGERSSVQRAPLFHRQALDFGDGEMAQTEWRIRAEAWEREQVRAGKLPVYKNPADHCNWCQFKEACELHEMGGDWRSVLQLEFAQWDPYEDHDKEYK